MDSCRCDRLPATMMVSPLWGRGPGAVVTTCSDAVVVHFGHKNVWDIRVAEHTRDKIPGFA